MLVALGKDGGTEERGGRVNDYKRGKTWERGRGEGVEEREGGRGYGVENKY